MDDVVEITEVDQVPTEPTLSPLHLLPGLEQTPEARQLTQEELSAQHFAHDQTSGVLQHMDKLFEEYTELMQKSPQKAETDEAFRKHIEASYDRAEITFLTNKVSAKHIEPSPHTPKIDHHAVYLLSMGEVFWQKMYDLARFGHPHPETITREQFAPVVRDAVIKFHDAQTVPEKKPLPYIVALAFPAPKQQQQPQPAPDRLAA